MNHSLPWNLESFQSIFLLMWKEPLKWESMKGCLGEGGQGSRSMAHIGTGNTVDEAGVRLATASWRFQSWSWIENEGRMLLMCILMLGPWEGVEGVAELEAETGCWSPGGSLDENVGFSGQATLAPWLMLVVMFPCHKQKREWWWWHMAVPHIGCWECACLGAAAVEGSSVCQGSMSGMWEVAPSNFLSTSFSYNVLGESKPTERDRSGLAAHQCIGFIIYVPYSG